MHNLSIQRQFYTMAAIKDQEAEITLYGEIVEKQPTNYWTGAPIEGSFIIESEFLEDLNEVIAAGCKKLTIRMNSFGGDAGVSILIHNRLREHAKNGMELVCIVDGVAMSGGSLIMCACDRVIVNPSSLIMIHKSWSFVFGGYNADELRSLASQNDAWDKAQVSIYKRKTNLSDTVITHMMADTTYMTGKEAIEKGFANELTEEGALEIAASEDRKSIFVAGRAMHLHGIQAPDSIPITTANADVINENMSAGTDTRGGTKPMAKNFKELQVEDPELAAQVEADVRAAVSAEQNTSIADAVKNERKRVSEIDEIAHLFSDDIVREAKYGDNPCTAQEMTFRAAQVAAKQGTAFMSNMKADNDDSGANGVEGTPRDNDGVGEDSPEALAAQAKADVAKFTKSKEGK